MNSHECGLSRAERRAAGGRAVAGPSARTHVRPALHGAHLGHMTSDRNTEYYYPPSALTNVSDTQVHLCVSGWNVRRASIISPIPRVCGHHQSEATGGWAGLRRSGDATLEGLMTACKRAAGRRDAQCGSLSLFARSSTPRHPQPKTDWKGFK